MRLSKASIILTLALAGCAGSAELDSSAGDSTTQSQSAPPVEETNDQIAAFGERWGYDGGLSMVVTQPRRHRFSQYAAGYAVGDIGVAFTVKIRNRTGEVFDPALMQVEVVGGPDGAAGEPVYDSPGFDGSLTAKIANGRVASAKYGFAFPAGADVTPIQVQVTPDFDSSTIIYEGRVRR